MDEYGKDKECSLRGKQNGAAKNVDDSNGQAASTAEGAVAECQRRRIARAVCSGGTVGTFGGILGGQLVEQLSVTEQLIAFHQSALMTLQAQHEFLSTLRDRLGEVDGK
jgi:hypothetical protein